MTERISKKVVLVGDPGCGKTSLLVVFSTKEKLDKTTPDKLKNEPINVEVDGTKVALSVSTTAGEKSGRWAGLWQYHME